MVVCPNCNHHNPEGATQCEDCYAPLPMTINCPNCGASIQNDATYCGQCGFHLKTETSTSIPDTLINSAPSSEQVPEKPQPQPQPQVVTPVMPTPVVEEAKIPPNQPPTIPPTNVTPVSSQTSANNSTQLQLQTGKLVHVQTNSTLELPQNLPVIHIGRPNDHIPPDIDVSPFADSDVVSRVHADIRIEGDNFFIEDLGSANGTYVNGQKLLQGNRHKLRSGDRISLGKQDKVSFIFSLS